jgi:methylase of polypeptide subunit release factors
MIQSVVERTSPEKSEKNREIGKKQEDNVVPLAQGDQNILIDVGTGCGVLGLSCMLLAPQAWAHAYLTDYEPQIIELTRKNLHRHQGEIVNRGSTSIIELITASMLDWVNSDLVSLRNTHQNIVIVANLPYIPETTFDQNVDESAKKWEPREAFV